MEKLLKIVKIIFYVLLFALAITFVVCLFAIPQETKDFVKGAMVFINQPLPIVGVSIITGGFLIYKIIDITPIGRKGYNAIKDDLLKEKDKIIGYKQVAEEKLKELSTTKNECLALLQGYSDRIEQLEEELLKVCETSPNAKIKALGEEYQAKKVQIVKETNEKYDLAHNELATKLETTKYDLDTILKELNELKEKVYGKETKDN